MDNRMMMVSVMYHEKKILLILMYSELVECAEG